MPINMPSSARRDNASSSPSSNSSQRRGAARTARNVATVQNPRAQTRTLSRRQVDQRNQDGVGLAVRDHRRRLQMTPLQRASADNILAEQNAQLRQRSTQNQARERQGRAAAVTQRQNQAQAQIDERLQPVPYPSQTPSPPRVWGNGPPLTPPGVTPEYARHFRRKREELVKERRDQLRLSPGKGLNMDNYRAREMEEKCNVFAATNGGIDSERKNGYGTPFNRGRVRGIERPR